MFVKDRNFLLRPTLVQPILSHCSGWTLVQPPTHAGLSLFSAH